MPTQILTQNHYNVLSLPFDPSATRKVSDQDVKAAYRRALLLHHPDKSPSTNPTRLSTHTIDQITLAYKTLIDPCTRAEHDCELALKPADTRPGWVLSHPGLEVVDLDDMGYDEEHGMWYRECRCGKQRGYVVQDEELEANVEAGELITGCEGCSLWLRVTFAVVDDG
ncbi:Diphthamide biosynthesis protein 4 [Puttea exsequens]|nr:Diphthamide biosynthesis protein 4 [Puttea exsequens]